LDLNCFNRPFDDQGQVRVAQETAAVFSILHRIIGGIDSLAWSAILDFENAQHLLADRRTEIGRWSQRAAIHVAISEKVVSRAAELTKMGLRALDAAHLASAEAAACDYFLTCDDQLTRRAQFVPGLLPVQNPTEFLKR
jgi:predicted nucleic acid-binding protein